MSVAEVEGFLNDLVLDVSKAALKSSQLSEMHESDTEIYLFMYIYFQRAAMRQKREDEIAMTRETVEWVLTQLLPKAMPTTGGAAAKKKAAAPAAGGGDGGGAVPLMQQRALREQLSARGANLTAFAEIIEMCRFVAHAQQQRATAGGGGGAKEDGGGGGGSASVAFGAVNVLHFAAIAVSLLPHRRLFELIELVWNTAELSEATRIAIFDTWSVVDAQNREALQDLCRVLTQRPGMNVPMLLEFYPHVQHINTNKYRGAPATVGGASATAVAPKSVVHQSEDVASLAAAPVQPPQLAVHHGTGDGGGSDDDDDDDDGRTDADRAFWADLVS